MIFVGQNTGSPAVKGNGILHTPVSPRLPHSSSFSPFRRSNPPPSFTFTRFDDGILFTPHFSTRLLSPSSLRRSGSVPTCSGPPQQAFSTSISRSSPSTLGAHALSFSPVPSPQFFHLLLICLLSSRLFLFLPPPPISACASCVTSLSSSSPSSSRTMFCAMSFLSCHYQSLCVSV